MNRRENDKMKLQPKKINLLIISHVFPYPKNSGQGLRVHYTLKALRPIFNIVFLTSESFIDQESEEEAEIRLLCDELILLPTVYKRSHFDHIFIKFSGAIYSFFTGLKFSNFLAAYFEFSPKRIRMATLGLSLDLVLFEYWHAYKSISVFKSRNIPCILDMHNVLLHSYISQYDWTLPRFVKRIHIRKYQIAEVNSWKSFDAIIAINNSELNYVKRHVSSSVKLFYIAMGIDMSVWPYVWQPCKPQRLAYYGGMGSLHNKRNALFCVESVMPFIWEKYPDTEFWIIGNDPDNELVSLEEDPRIHVTGYQEKVQDSLKYISVFLCPWHGKYGFRSRIIEVMATGVPVICSRDAVDGMELQEGEGLFFAESGPEFASLAVAFLSDKELLANQSKQARKQVEEIYSFENTYQSGFEEIKIWVLNR